MMRPIVKDLIATALMALLCACANTRTAVSQQIGPTKPNKPQPGQVIRFDAHHYLSYESPHEGTRNTALLLKYALGGALQTWDLTPYQEHCPLDIRVVYGIHYVDANHAWLITHMSKRFGGAVLLNLKTRVTEKGFAFGFPYAISPDGFKLAYAFPLGHNDQDIGVMVDGLLIYPEVRLIGNPTGNPEHFMEITMADLDPHNRKVVSRIKDESFGWINDHTFKFIVEEWPESKHPDYDKPGKYYEYTVTGLKRAFAAEPVNLKAIKVNYKELALEEAQRRIKEANTVLKKANSHNGAH